MYSFKTVYQYFNGPFNQGYLYRYDFPKTVRLKINFPSQTWKTNQLSLQNIIVTAFTLRMGHKQIYSIRSEGKCALPR